MRLTLVEGVLTPGGGSSTVGPAKLYRGFVKSDQTRIAWWPPQSGPADSYNVYRQDFSSSVPYQSGIVETPYGTDPDFPGVSFGSLWFDDWNGRVLTSGTAVVNPGTAYTYWVTAVIGGVESLASPSMTLTTLSGSPGTTLPAAVTDPSTYVTAPPASYGGTIWTVTQNDTNQAGQTGTGVLGNVGCSFNWAGNKASPGDTVVLTAGQVYTSTVGIAAFIWNVSGTASQPIIVTTTADPVFQSGGTLIPYSAYAQGRMTYSALTLGGTLPGISATTGTLATAWAQRNQYLSVIFSTGEASGYEHRMVHFVQGSTTINWNTPLRFAVTGATGHQVYSSGVAINPDDASYATLQFNGNGDTPSNGGNGINVNGSFIRFIGINFAPRPGIPGGKQGFACVTNNGTNNTFDRCLGGSDTTLANWSQVLRWIFNDGAFLVVNQCFMYGLSGGYPPTFGATNASDSQVIYCHNNGPVCVQSSFLECSSESVFSGGGWIDPTKQPHDVTVRGCYSQKNGGWSFQPFGDWPKNHVEFKLMTGAEIYDNIFQNNWFAFGTVGQNGRAMNLGPIDQPAEVAANRPNCTASWSGGIASLFVPNMTIPVSDIPPGTQVRLPLSGFTPTGYNGTVVASFVSSPQGGCNFTYPIGTDPGGNGTGGVCQQIMQATQPWNHVSDVNVHDNLMLGVATGFYPHQDDGHQPGGYCERFWFHNNVVWINPLCRDNHNTLSNGWAVNLGVFVTDVTIDHNTIITIPSNTGFLVTGASQHTAGLQALSTPQYLNQPLTVDHFTLTNNLIDGFDFVTVTTGSGHGGFTGSGTAAQSGFFNTATLTWSNNINATNGVVFPAFPTGAGANSNLGGVYTSAISGFLGNTVFPPLPSSWTVNVAPYSTGSTTGGPIGAIIQTQPLTITSGVGSATVGQAYSNQMTATGGVAPYTWSMDFSTPGKHLWLDITSTGLLYGTPQYDSVGEGGVGNLVQVRVTDSTGATTSVQRTITIVTSGTLTINSPTTLPTAAGAGGYAYQLTATGGAPPIIGWKITGHTGSNTWFIEEDGWIHGVPQSLTSDTVTVQAVDCENNTSAGVTFTIPTSGAMQLANIDYLNNVINLPTAVNGVKYRHQLHASYGGTGTGQVFSIVNGTLPAGLTMNSAGLITGVPTATGSASCSLKCTDSASNVTPVVPISLNVIPAQTDVRPTHNTGNGFYVGRNTGRLCDPTTGTVWMHRGINQNNPLQGNTSAWPQSGASSCRYTLFTTQFRGNNPGGSATAASYMSDAFTKHTSIGQYVIFTQFAIPGQSGAPSTLSGNQAASSIGTCAAWLTDSYAAWHASGLEGKSGINIANEWGPPSGGGGAASTVWRDAYAAAWSGAVQSGVWQMPVASVNTGTGVITLAASVNDASNPLTAASAIGYVYFSGGNINKAVAISSVGGSSGAYTVTVTTPGDISAWTSGGTISGGALGIIRAGGYVNDPIYIDAGGFGQAISDFVTYGATVGQSDPLQNVVLSYHCYGTTVNLAGRIGAVTKAANAVVTLISNAAQHPLQGLLGTNTTIATVTSVGGMTQLNGEWPVVTTGGSSPNYTVTLNVNSTAFGTYTSGGLIVAAGSSPYHHIDRLCNTLLSIRQSGIDVQIGEFGPSGISGASNTTMSYMNVVQSAEAAGIPWVYWAMDDTSGLGIVNGNPSQYFFGCTGTLNNNAYTSPQSWGPNGQDVIMNPRYGIHALAVPAPVFL